MEEQKMEIKKGRKNFWYIFDVCLFGFCVLLFLIQWDPIEIVGYLIGYFGRSTGEVFLLWLFCWPMYVLVLIIGVFRMIKWQDSLLNPWKVLLMRIVLFILMSPLQKGGLWRNGHRKPLILSQ